MAATLAIECPQPTAAAHPTVVMCYRLLDLASHGGAEDFTDGIYAAGEGDSRADYLRAQWRQSEYLLDEIDCRVGARILDIGCGNGRLLRQAEQRGAHALGITISPEQVRRCRRQGLAAHLLNYRALPDEWNGIFDGLVANGSLEHFVSLEEAAAGADDRRYGEMFAICRRLVTSGRRLATTAIHFRDANAVRAADLLRGPQAFDRDSPQRHFATVLACAFGGWYPQPGQLERSARGHFRLLRAVDGTDDYRRTSEYWLRRLRWQMVCNPRVWAGLAHKLLTCGRSCSDMLRCLLVEQSWNWQFRGPRPPTVLLRQTWEAV